MDRNQGGSRLFLAFLLSMLTPLYYQVPSDVVVKLVEPKKTPFTINRNTLSFFVVSFFVGLLGPYETMLMNSFVFMVNLTRLRIHNPYYP